MNLNNKLWIGIIISWVIIIIVAYLNFKGYSELEYYAQLSSDLREQNKVDKITICEEMCFAFADQDGDGWVRWTVIDLPASESIINYCPSYCLRYNREIQ